MKGSIRHIHWIGQLFILAGVYLIGEFIFLQLALAVIGLLYPGMQFLTFITSFDSITSVDAVTKDQVNALKLFQTITSFGRFIVIGCFILYLRGDAIISSLQLKKIPLVSLILILLIILSCGPLINIVNAWNTSITLPAGLHAIEASMRAMEDQAKMQSDVLLSATHVSGLITNLCIIALLAAIGEELFFRGVLQKIFLSGIKNAHIAIWLTAFLFSFIHFQFFGFFPRLLLGALMGYLFYWSGSLWSSIAAHFINNAVTVIATFLINTGRLDRNIAEESSWQSALIAIPFVILFMAAFLRLSKNKRIPDGEGLDDGVFDNR